MPEMPEVETVRRGLEPWMDGATIQRVEQRRENLRFPFPDQFVERLSQRQVIGLRRRAKYLLIDLDSQETVISHLGMSGSYRIEAASSADKPGVFHHDRSKLEKHDHIVFHMNHPTRGSVSVTYNDPRRFGFMLMSPSTELSNHALIKDIGIEPLGNALSGPLLLSLFANKATSLKAALLDQRLIAGLGNIYVCEALWRARMSPFAPAGGLSSTQSDVLASVIRAVLEEAIEAGGSSLRDHRQADGSLGYFQHRFAAYDRQNEACRHEQCAGTIARTVQNGRSTFHCLACQT